MAEKLKLILELEEKYGNRFRFLSESWTKPKVEAFRAGTPDDLSTLIPFWNAAKDLGKMAMNAVISSSFGSGEMLAVCVPRGAYPMAQGVLENYQMPLIVTNDGGNRDHSSGLIPFDLPQKRFDKIILIDPVIDTGKTCEETIRALSSCGVKARSAVAIAVIAHPPTVEKLLKQFRNLSIVTADIETETIPAPDGSGGRWLAGFGDIGGNVAAAADAFPLLQKHLLQPGYYP